MSKAYTKEILPFGSGIGEEESVHQSSPGWVLTFVRWAVRDTLRTKKGQLDLTAKQVLIVENDCIDLKVVSSKGSMTPSMEATLKNTDINYLTALNPGDFVMVNMFNYDMDARKLVERITVAGGNTAINGKDDGFKGFFKVQSVRESIGVDPESGKKIVVTKVTGFAFTEFNNTIYFNPHLVNTADKNNDLLFANYIGQFWQKMVNDKGTNDVQTVVALLIQCFLGTGVSAEGSKVGQSLVRSVNTHFHMPSQVGALLGQRRVKAAKDVYNYLFGIQRYASGNVTNIEAGMNPIGLQQKFEGRFYYTPDLCEGRTILKAEYWNNVKTWSILNQYLNSPLNELYTCFRMNPSGQVMPTLVMRQIPFTTEALTTSTKVTRFMNLPRWKISPALVVNYDLGKDEAARINFVQYFGASVNDKTGSALALETAKGNYVYDIKDVQRSGLRPYIVSTQFDEIVGKDVDKGHYRSPIWASVIGDALIGGQQKMNGTMLCHGIQDPIAIGDNAEFNGIVYHIEQIEHACAISVGDGKKMFRTKVSLSNGVSVNSEEGLQRYAEMDFTSAYADRDDDFNNRDGILPGVSEAQDTNARKKTDIDIGKQQGSNYSFPQPDKTRGYTTQKKKGGKK